MADYAARAAPRADPFRSNPPYADDPPYELLWKRSREPALEQLVGWVERPRPPKLDLAKVEAKPIDMPWVSQGAQPILRALDHKLTPLIAVEC